MRYWSILMVLSLLSSCKRQAIEGVLKSNEEVAAISDVKTNERGIVYISKDDGRSWENRSNGIPDNVFLTDIAVSNNSLGIATKQHGIYLYDFTIQMWKPIKNNKPTSSDIDAFFMSDEKLYVGTHGEGVFISENNGKEWGKINAGLRNLTIRRLLKIGNKLFAGTNGGLFSFDSKKNIWTKEYGDNALQVNGIALHDDEVYIGTNQGAFKGLLNHNNWNLIMPGRSLHNISVANGVIYAMAYNELFASKDKGESWYSDQPGLPDGMYSFQVIALGNEVFDGQWDGIYRKDKQENWVRWSNGLPTKIPITEMKTFSGILVAATSQWYTAD